MYSQHSRSFLDVYNVKQQDGVTKPIKGLDSTSSWMALLMALLIWGLALTPSLPASEVHV